MGIALPHGVAAANPAIFSGIPLAGGSRELGVNSRPKSIRSSSNIYLKATSMSCEDVRASLSAFDVCEDTSDGARVTTHCLYPSFEPVRVYVARMGDGFKVHDGGGAFATAWAHGRDEHLIGKSLKDECTRFHLSLVGQSFVAHVPSQDWLLSAILGVANASAAAATSAVSRMVAVAEAALVDRIQQTLTETVGAKGFDRGVDLVGKSGGTRHFDFAIKGLHDNEPILINGVSPHHASISHKYVAFADAEGDQDHKFAVYDRKLDTDDVALLQQVASILPLAALSHNAMRVINL